MRQARPAAQVVQIGQTESGSSAMIPCRRSAASLSQISAMSSSCFLFCGFFVAAAIRRHSAACRSYSRIFCMAPLQNKSAGKFQGSPASAAREENVSTRSSIPPEASRLEAPACSVWDWGSSICVGGQLCDLLGALPESHGRLCPQYLLLLVSGGSASHAATVLSNR